MRTMCAGGGSISQSNDGLLIDEMSQGAKEQGRQDKRSIIKYDYKSIGQFYSETKHKYSLRHNHYYMTYFGYPEYSDFLLGTW